MLTDTYAFNSPTRDANIMGVVLRNVLSVIAIQTGQFPWQSIVVESDFM